MTEVVIGIGGSEPCVCGVQPDTCLRRIPAYKSRVVVIGCAGGREWCCPIVANLRIGQRLTIAAAVVNSLLVNKTRQPIVQVICTIGSTYVGVLVISHARKCAP